MSAPAIDTHDMLVDFGKYRGERYTRLPISYLRWMVNAAHGKADIAKAELDRRGVPVMDDFVEISGHAIDTASLRAWFEYMSEREENEGLHAWLKRITKRALQEGRPNGEGRLQTGGRVVLVVEEGATWLTVKTVLLNKSK